MLSFLLHLLIFFLFIYSSEKIQFPAPHTTEEQKITLNLSKFIVPPQTSSLKTSLPPLTPTTLPIKPTPKPKPQKRPPKTPPKQIIKKPEPQNRLPKPKIEPKKEPTAKPTIQKSITQKTKSPTPKKVTQERIKKPKKPIAKRIVKKKPIKKRKKSKDKLANALMQNLGFNQPKKRQKRQRSHTNYKMKTIQRLYGKRFHSYSSTQKNFIKRNLGAIHRITQRTLTQNGYPDVAGRTLQQGTNIVSFDLHPNGDISNLKLKRAIGYRALDQNTLEVIRIAYQNYPRPKTKTRIIFYVKYFIY